MKTQSAKAKGRRFQQWVRDKLIESLGIHPEDIESRSMGAGGEDLIMARSAREYDYTVAVAQTRDIDGIIVKLNTTYQQELKDEVEAQNFFLN